MPRLEFNSREYRVGCLMQVTIGTAIAASGNFQTIRFDTATYDPDHKIFKLPSSDNQRLPIQANWASDTAMSVPKLTLSGTISRWELANFLMLAIQTCTEGVGTPFVKDYTIMSPPKQFTSGQLVGATEGYVATFAIFPPVAGEGYSFKDVVCTRLKLSGNRVAGGLDALMKYEAEFLGFTPLDDQTLSGTWVAQDTTMIPVNTSTIVLNDAANNLTWRTCEVEINNNVMAIPGNVSWMFGDPVCSMRANIHYNSLSSNFGTDYTDKTAKVIYWGSSTAVDVAAEWRFTIKGFFSKFVNPVPYVDFEIGEAADTAAGANDGFIAAYADAVDRGF